MHRQLCAIAFGTGIVLALSSAATQTPQLKTYRDARYGVTFRYPPMWKADPNRHFYMQTEIMINPKSHSEADDVQLIKIGFDRSLGPDGAFPDRVNLEGVEFLYLVLPKATAEACYVRLPEPDEEHKSSEAEIHGVMYKRVQDGEGGLGHGVYRDIYAAYRGGRCYLFEGDIHTLAANNTKFLQGKALLELQNQMAAVMQSVTIEASNSH